MGSEISLAPSETHVLGQQLLVVTDVALPGSDLLLITHPDLI